MSKPSNQEIVEQNFKEHIQRLEMTLKALISWMASSANSPISRREAEELIKILDGKEP